MHQLILTTLLGLTLGLNAAFAQNKIFETYPWLTDIVQPNDCSISSVELYQQGVFYFLLVTDENETQQLYFENGTFYCQNSAGYDCVAVYNLGDPVDIWTCGDGESTCLVTITNIQCRQVGVYDAADNLLTTMTPDRPLPPPGYTAPQWIDPSPLGESETRTYIFKENNLVLGQQTVSCENNTIGTVSAYFNSCTDAIGFEEFENTGCRTLTAYNSNSQVEFTLAPGESKSMVESIPVKIYTFLAGKDTIVIGRRGPINSGGCATTNSIPDDFQAYNVIYRLCQGETLTIPNPYREVQCPLSPDCLNGPSICENFPFLQQVEWTSSTGEIVSLMTPRPGESFVTFAPTETTVYEGIIPSYRCGSAPSGPLGNPLKYLVIVEDAVDCSPQSAIDRPTVFEVSACRGEQISLPIPYREFCTEGFFVGNPNIAELISINENVLELKVLGSGFVDYNPTAAIVQVGEPSSTQPNIKISCPLVSYQFNIQIAEDCEEVTEQNDAIFTDFPWLTNLIDLSNCSDESISIYQQGIYQYLLVTDAEGNSNLYNQAGLFYCQNADNFDCVTAYGFDAPISVWNCGATTPPLTPNCSNYEGTIFYELCDDGQEFYFIRTTDGKVYDPYFADDYLPLEGQVLNFDFVDAPFNTPCSIAEKAINVTCYELMEFSLFSKYPFLTNLVDPDNCQNGRIEEYNLGNYAFLFVHTGSGNGTLYYQDGTFYCQDAPNYNCRAAYGLTTPTDSWTCSNLSFPQANDRNDFSLKNNDLRAFPNPTTGMFWIEFPLTGTSAEQLQIIDMMGRLVQTIKVPSTLNAKRMEIDLSDLQDGIYYVKYGRLVKKIIKQGLQ